MNKINIHKKLGINIFSIIILIVLFISITYAITKHIISYKDNLFKTGIVKINLNDGQTIINSDELLFEPGMTITKDFFIENQSTFDVYYKIYFSEVSGELADILKVTIKNKDKVLYEDSIKNLSRKKVKTVEEELKVNEKITLNISFHYPEEASNQTQNATVTFRLSADAVQTKNNPQKLFN